MSKYRWPEPRRRGHRQRHAAAGQEGESGKHSGNLERRGLFVYLDRDNVSARDHSQAQDALLRVTALVLLAETFCGGAQNDVSVLVRAEENAHEDPSVAQHHAHVLVEPAPKFPLAHGLLLRLTVSHGRPVDDDVGHIPEMARDLFTLLRVVFFVVAPPEQPDRSITKP